ncbi:unnamed protein product [Effrenium voratum]|nr:unnamed protein product [Effrenium voratum]
MGLLNGQLFKQSYRFLEELCREYTREAYDVLQHNCNHFSDEVAMFLLNKHIPEEVRSQPQQLADSLTAQENLRSRFHSIAMSSSLAIPRAPLALALLALVSRIRRRAKALALRAVPNWPPAPKVLLRKGGLAVVLGLLLLWLTRGPTKDVLEDDGMRDWVTKEREKRRKKLLDLLAQLPLRRLQRLVPLPELEEKLKEEGEKKDEQIEEVEEPLKFPITAESVADAAEDLAKAESSAPAARLGFAVAGALSACELQMLARKAARAPEEAQAAECDALQQRLRELQDFAETLALRCERSFARRLGRSFGAAAKEAEALVRQRRLAQWRCVAALLWRFKGTLPFMGLASLLSMVLGAFSAIRFHYQAAVINLAKDAVTGSKAASSIEETVGAMLVSEAIVQLADFARARLTLLGKSKVVQELKVALFAALLRQDLDYLEQCDLWQLRATIGSTGTIVSQVVDFPAILVEALARLLAAVLALGRQNGRLAAFLGVMLPLRLLLSQLLQHLENQLQRNGLPDFKGQINSCWSCLVRPAALRTMRAFAREPTELAAFARFLRVQDELQQRSTLVFRMMQPAQVLLEHMLEIGTLWYGGRLALRGEMAFGELSSAVLVASGAFEGARYAQCAAANVSQQALGPMAQMAQLLGRTPRIGLEEPPLASMPDVNAMRWDLEFREVHFSYHRGAAVLRGLSFKLRQEVSSWASWAPRAPESPRFCR